LTKAYKINTFHDVF